MPKNTNLKSKMKKKKSRKKKFNGLISKFNKYDFLKNKNIVINPKGHEKMSDILMRFVDPYIDFSKPEEEQLKILSISALAWNVSILNTDAQIAQINKISLESFPENSQHIRNILNELVSRKNRYFADIKRYIIDFEYKDLGDNYHLTVASTLDLPKD